MNSECARLWFGRATRPDEFEQIFYLNHATFVEEIPQHAAREDRRLIDPFHTENEYVICKCNGKVIGMVALRGRRPFSLDNKLADLDGYLPANRTLCEIRLLVVRVGYRHSRVLPGLIRELVRICRHRGYEYALISATTRQLKLYTHLGFEPFGPQVGQPGAYYQPMGMAIEQFERKVPWLESHSAHTEAKRARDRPKCLLPGPVDVHASVLAAAGKPPEYHRSSEVTNLLDDCRQRLAEFTHSEEVQVMLGSGTLANDAIAQQLRLSGSHGVILANGEFGERLVDHGRRADLRFTVYRESWGRGFNFHRIADALKKEPPPRWMWMVHCETSTGVLNDLRAFKSLAREFGSETVVDSISSLGNVKVDLNGTSYAAGVSGKGLGGLPGLAFVFYRRGQLREGRRVPRYLDLALYARSAGVPFTHSSNLLWALLEALKRVQPGSFDEREDTCVAVRAALKRYGLRSVDDGRSSAPFVVTIALPPEIPSARVGAAMLGRGYRIAFESRYLVERNWIQLAWMGDVDRSTALAAIAQLAHVLEVSASMSLVQTAS